MGAAGEALEGPSSLRYTFADPITANLEGAVTFEAPELPEETLMEVGMVNPRGKGQGNKSKAFIKSMLCFQRWSKQYSKFQESKASEVFRKPRVYLAPNPLFHVTAHDWG